VSSGRRTLVTIAVALATSAVLAACGAAADDEISLTPGTQSESATTAAPVTAAPQPAAQCTDANATESYRTLSPMPAAKNMPAGSTMRKIQDRGRLVVGVSADTLRFGARNPLNGRIEGFDVDMLREVARAIFGDPDKIEFKVITYAQRLPNLESGRVDMVAHTMTINCVRWNRIAFSSEYYSAGQKLLVGKDVAATGVKALADLVGKTVCVAKGSTNEQELAKYTDVIAFKVDDLTDCVVAFQQGKADAITGDDTVLAGFAAQDPYAQVLPDAFTAEPYGLGINADQVDLVRFVNGVLEQLRTSGAWTRYYSTWVGALTPGDPVPNPPPARYGRPDAVLGA
jgi:polar amino acid transport system substrate-binding protein